MRLLLALARRHAALVAQVQLAADVRRHLDVVADIGLGHAVRATTRLVPARFLAGFLGSLGPILADGTGLLGLAALLRRLRGLLPGRRLGGLFGLPARLFLGLAASFLFRLAPGLFLTAAAVGFLQRPQFLGLLRARLLELAQRLQALGLGRVHLLLVQHRALHVGALLSHLDRHGRPSAALRA